MLILAKIDYCACNRVSDSDRDGMLPKDVADIVNYMRMPGDPITDYNVKVPIWDVLNISCRPEKYTFLNPRDPEHEKEVQSVLRAYQEAEKSAAPASQHEIVASMEPLEERRRFRPPGYEFAKLDDDDPVQIYADKYLIHQYDPSYRAPPDLTAMVDPHRQIFKNHVGIEVSCDSLE